MIFTAGLILIAAGWMAQVYKTWFKKERELSPVLLPLYAIGCVLLLTGNFLAGDITTGILNSVCAVLAASLLAAILI